MPDSASQGIFLSYRREDAAPYARLLQFQLRGRFPDARVFMDLDSIEAGLDFAEVIEQAVTSCAVLVALIGPRWATLADEDGARRLDNPDDFVRFELQTALERGVRVVPVLVDGARALRQRELPAELSKLARLNALELSYGRYEYDADRLLGLIQRVLAEDSGRSELEQQGQEQAEQTRQGAERKPSTGRQATRRKDEDAAPVRQLSTSTRSRRVLLQGDWGEQGNFELLVPHGNVIRQYVRDNDDPACPWHYLREFGYPAAAGQPGPTPRSVTFIQSSFRGDGQHGNFEAIVRVAPPLATEPDRLDFWWLDSKTYAWNGPSPLSAGGTPLDGITGD